MTALSFSVFDYMSLKEYQITYDDYYGQHKLIRSIYKSAHLNNDAYWHYFREDGYLLIRVHDKSCKKLETTLKRRRLKYKKIDMWDEACSSTAIEFIDFFGPYFHLISELFMNNAITEIEDDSILERVVHCLLNHSMQEYSDTTRLHYLMGGMFYGRGMRAGMLKAREKKNE